MVMRTGSLITVIVTATAKTMKSLTTVIITVIVTVTAKTMRDLPTVIVTVTVTETARIMRDLPTVTVTETARIMRDLPMVIVTVTVTATARIMRDLPMVIVTETARIMKTGNLATAEAFAEITTTMNFSLLLSSKRSKCHLLSSTRTTRRVAVAVISATELTRKCFRSAVLSA